MQVRFFAGLDLGQSHDYTALTIMEREPDVAPALYELRFLQRFPLRVPYPDIVDGVSMVVSTPQLHGQAVLLVDNTGVGAPVVDLLKKAKLPVVKLCPVTITGGNTVTRDGNNYHVPKRDLATAVKILLDSERLKVSTALPQYALLVKELEAFRVKINVKTAHDSYEAWREGDHDDLVLSVAIACWYAEQSRKKMFAGVQTPPSPASSERFTVRKINDTVEEITFHPPTAEETRKAQEGWTWSDILRNGR